MGRCFNRCKWLFPLALTAWATYGFAAGELNPDIPNKHLLENAVQLQITPRGMEFFDSRLSEILGNLGVKLDEGYFPALEYTFKKPMRPDDFAVSNPEEVKMYKHVRDLLTRWLVGFSLNDHQPTLRIGESGYLAQFSRFGIVTDKALMQALGKRDGAVLAVELEIKKMIIYTDSVTAWDTKNEILGKVGIEGLTISTDSAKNNQVPLKIRLPFYIRMQGDILQFEALVLDTNIDEIPLSMKYKKLIVPTFTVELNNQKYQLNNEELDRFFTSKTPMALEKIRENLGDFARKKLPDLLNQKAREFLTGALEQVQEIIPPGKEITDPRPGFKWGIKLQKINLEESLKIDLTAYMEDPLRPNAKPAESSFSHGPTSFELVPANNYDIGLSIDRALINRVLQLSFLRKNFEKIKLKDGSSLKLAAAPTVDYIKAPASDIQDPRTAFVKLHVSVETQPESIFLKETIVMDFDITLKLQQKGQNPGTQMILHSINPESLYLEDQYISLAGSLIKGKVREGVKDQLREISARWKKNEETVPGNFLLPPKILGLQLLIQRIAMNQNGHLVMYLNYATKGVK